VRRVIAGILPLVLFAVAGCEKEAPTKAPSAQSPATQPLAEMGWQQHQERGIALDKEGDTAGAVESFTMALKGSPPNPALHFLRGSARLKIDDAAGAAQDFEEGLKLDPENEPLKVLLRAAQEKLNQASIKK